MKCVNCHKEIPATSRFCLHCGAAQPEIQLENRGGSTPVTRLETSAADGHLENTPEPPQEDKDWGIDWLAREAALDPRLDYEAQRQFGDFARLSMGCLTVFFFCIMGLLLLVPGVPLLAVFGVPAALVLTPLTYFNIGKLQERLHNNRFLKNLPGFTSTKPLTLALSVFFYLGGLSVFCYALLAVTLRR